MKVSVGVFALCLALCYASVPGWKDGKKYIYEYEGRFGSGVSDDAVTQFAGKGLRGRLHVYHTDNHLAVEFHDGKEAEFNRRMGSVFEVLDLTFNEPTDPDLKAVVSELEKPWFGEFGKDGRIINSKHTTLKENVYSNTQRAILSLLQVVFPSDHAHDHYYDVNESGIGGDCPTDYVINHFPDDWHEDEQVLNITKSYRYDECTYRPHLFFTSLVGYECDHCKEKNYHIFEDFGRVEYEIKGNREHYTIQNIQATGYVTFAPFTSNGQIAISLTNQTLHLVSVEDYTAPAVPSDAETCDGLYFRFNLEDHDYDTEDLKENYALGRVYPKKYVERRMNDFFDGETSNIAQASALLRKLTPGKFAEYREIAQVTDLLGHVLFTFDYEDFEKLFTQEVNMASDAKPEEKDRRNFMLKMLTLVGTNPAILFALDKIRTEKVPEKIEAEIISVLPFYVKTPSKPLLEEYRKFVTSDYVNADHSEILYSVAWSAWGSLIARACIKDDFNNHPHRKDTFVDKETCEKHVKMIIDAFNSATKWEERSVLIGAIKNTQTEWAYKFMIDEVIPGHKYNEYVRAAAIWGLEHYIDDEEHEKKINEVLVPIFTDHHEDYLLRIYAFDILMDMHQDYRFFNHLVFMVNSEPNSQVASYIWSTLASLANTTDPCYQNVTQHAREALPFITRKDYDYDFLRHSTNKIFSFYNEQYGFGRTSQLIVVGGNNTAIPRELYLRQSVNLAGYNFDISEMGFVQRDNHAIDTVIAAALEQYSLMYTPKMGGEDFGFSKNFDPIKAVSKMTSEIYSRIFDQDVAVAHKIEFPKESAYFTRVDDHTGELHYTKVVSGAQVEYVVPNMVGLPVYLHLFAPAVMKLDGTVSYKVERTSQTEFPKIILTPDLKYVFDMEVRASILVDNSCDGAYGYLLRTDAGMKFPIHGEFEMDFKSHEFKSKEIVSEEPYDMLYYDTQPSTFTKNNHLLPVKYSNKPVERQYKFGHNYFGAGLKVQLSYDYYWNDYGSYRTFFKTFFHKSTRYEDYFDLADRWYAGSRGFFDYAILNPTARPFHLNVRFERSTTNPTKEVHSCFKCSESEYYNEERSDAKHAWHTEKLEWDIEAKGPVERKWELEWEVARTWPVVTQRNVKFHWKRTALPNYDDKPYEICFESQVDVTGRTEIIANPLNPGVEAKMEYDATLTVGQDCSASSARKVTFKGELTKSQEQRDLDHEKLPMYQKCKDDISRGYEYSLACWLVKKDQGRLDHLMMDISYDPTINPKVKDFFQRSYLWFRHKYYNNLEIERDHDTGVAENHIKLDANFSYFQPIMDVHVYRPHEKVHYHKIFIPSIAPRAEPINIIESYEARYWRRTMRLQRPMCFLSGDYVYTLDGVMYKYPLGDCYHVAVANCLRENVLLMYRAVKDGKYSKAMKLIVDDHTIEIIPEGGELVAYADGTKILQDDKPIYINEVEDKEVFAVYEKYQGYVVVSKTAGLKIYFDGKNAKIKVSNLYHGVQCGMCGDFNNERHHEFRSVDGVLHREPAEFAHTYAIVRDGCHA